MVKLLSVLEERGPLAWTLVICHLPTQAFTKALV